MGRKILVFILMIVSAILLCGAVSAADHDCVSVKVGEDQVFTKMNYHQKSQSAVTNGNSASVTRTKDYDYAKIGVYIELDTGTYDWEDVKNTPIKVTYNLDYSLSADGEYESGSIVELDPFDYYFAGKNGNSHIYTYKPFGRLTNQNDWIPSQKSISVTNHIVSVDTTLEGEKLTIGDLFPNGGATGYYDKIRVLGIYIFTYGDPNRSSSSASVKINSIKIEFLSKPNVKPTNSPDLVVNSIKVPTNHLFVNDVVGLKISASNKGNATADSSVIKLYLKQNKSNAPMIPLGVSINVPSLKTKESEEFITKIKIPATYKINNKNQVLESGEYKLIARADAANNIKESNEANDYSTSISIGRKIALVCGITEYPKGSGDNITGASSAKNFATFLMSTLKFSNIKLIRDKDVTPENIEYYIQKSNIKPQDIFLFYFAGHGADDIVRDSDGDEILNNGKTIPNDNKGMIVLNKDGKVTNVNYSTLKNCLDQKKSWKTIVILDCCYSGDFIEEVNNKDQYITMTASRGDLTTQQIQGYKELQFTHYFMESFNNKAIFYNINPKERVRIVPREITDKNKDKMITTKEAFNYTQQKIYSEPQLQEKTPIILYYY